MHAGQGTSGRKGHEINWGRVSFVETYAYRYATLHVQQCRSETKMALLLVVRISPWDNLSQWHHLASPKKQQSRKRPLSTTWSTFPIPPGKQIWGHFALFKKRQEAPHPPEQGCNPNLE
jgi:hypothetical protein